jgi:hypothetical protein
MPGRKLPQSDPGRNRALTKAKTKNDSIAAPDRFLTAPTQTRLNTEQPVFKTALQNKSNALAAQAASTGTTGGAFARARMFISHFIQVFNLGVVRGVYLAAHRAFYHLDVSSDRVPVLSNEEDITTWGANLHDGDAARIAAGGAAMANPTIAQVDTETGAFNTDNVAQSLLKDALDTAEEAVAAQRAEADKVIKKVWDEVETFYNEEEPSSMRRKAREWGVVYLSDIKLTFHFLTKESAGHTALAGVNVELTETGNEATTGGDGKADMESTISDEATFEFSLADYITQQVVVPLPSGTTEFNVTVELVHV